jgi:hypothetical protein
LGSIERTRQTVLVDAVDDVDEEESSEVAGCEFAGTADLNASAIAARKGEPVTEAATRRKLSVKVLRCSDSFYLRRS